MDYFQTKLDVHKSIIDGLHPFEGFLPLHNDNEIGDADGDNKLLERLEYSFHELEDFFPEHYKEELSILAAHMTRNITSRAPCVYCVVQ